jgi:NAD(P)-dependent dehydrogenase (short-subunit alcohol dehydrogenase family)
VNLDRARAVVTGASEGIGRELALQLAARGAKLGLGARRLAELEAVAAECRARGGEAVAVACDVSRQADCARLVQRTVDAFGGLDLLVNNAGISFRARLDAADDLSAWTRVMEVNYLGAVYCTHAALPHLKASRGTIVAVSSGQGKTGFPGFSAYSASKFAMHGFFDSLRVELEGTGVRVTIVCPGPVATSIHTRRLGGEAVERKTTARAGRMDMSVEECARRTLAGVERDVRELMLMPGGTLMQWVKLVAPGFVDRQVAKGVRSYYTD